MNIAKWALAQTSLYLVLGLGWLQTTLAGNDVPTFNRDVAAIISKNCTPCHRMGEIGPFPLTTYGEVRKRAAMIQYVVSTRYMPPWRADPEYSSFMQERWLTAGDVQTIDRWVQAGAPMGSGNSPTLDATLPMNSLGEPDLVVGMTEMFVIPGNNKDHYRTFVVPLELEEDVELVGAYFRPGNPRLVHHAVIYVDASSEALKLDRNSPGYGFSSWEGMKVRISDVLPGYWPGLGPVTYPKGSGKRIPKGAVLLFNMHYAPTSREEADQSRLELYFADEPLRYHIVPTKIDEKDLIQGALFIPAGEKRRFEATKTFDDEITIVSLYPHMHYRGKSLLAYAVTPESHSKVPLLKIDDWDFNWQGSYTFPRPLTLPAGSSIHVHALFDNTAENPANPILPPQDARRGKSSSDEMLGLGLELCRPIGRQGAEQSPLRVTSPQNTRSEEPGEFYTVDDSRAGAEPSNEVADDPRSDAGADQVALVEQWHGDHSPDGRQSDTGKFNRFLFLGCSALALSTGLLFALAIRSARQPRSSSSRVP